MLRTDFSGSILRGEFVNLHFYQSSLSTCNMAGSVFTNVKFEFVNLEGCDLSESEFNGYIDMKNIEARNANFSYSIFRACIHNGNFRQANLFEVDFSNSDLDSCDFYMADLDGSNFLNADLTNVNFSGSSVFRSNFDNAILRNADFSSVELMGVSFKKSFFAETIVGI